MLKKEPACLFLNLDIGDVLTGIESAALLRSKVFIQHLGLHPIFVASRYHPQFLSKVENLKASGRAPSTLKTINLYDFVQGLADLSPHFQRPDCPPGLKPQPVTETKDVRYLDGSNHTVMYEVCDKPTGRLTYVNHFAAGKIWRRDLYHYSGRLSGSQFLDPVSRLTIQEVLYNAQGQVLAIKIYTHEGGEKNLVQMQLLDQRGFVERVFFSEEAFTTYALTRLIESMDASKILLFSDRSKFLYGPALDVRDALVERYIRVMPLVHNTHTKSETNIMTSGIKSHYANIFSDLSRPDAVVVLTEMQKRDIGLRFDVGKIRVIPHAYISKNPDRTGVIIPGRLVYLARFSPEKDHAAAIRIFARVLEKAPWATLACYGHGSGKPQIQALVVELGLQGKVLIEDFAEDVESIFLSAELSVLTSKMEGFALVVLESLFMGCPVVAYDIRYGPADQIEEGESGYLVPYGDEEAFAERVSRILLDKALRNRLATRAKTSMRDRFSDVSVSRKWAGLLSDLMGGEFAAL